MVLADGHIGLDAHLLFLKGGYRGAGVSHYIYHLLSHLAVADDSLRYTAYLPFHCPTLPEPIQQVVTSWPTWRPPVRILWEQFIAPFVALRQRVDLWHALVNVQPVFMPCPSLVTIQDLSFIHYPSSFHFGKRAYNCLLYTSDAADE